MCNDALVCFCRGREMERRRAEREREIESDTRDRQKEKEELEELKAKILSEGHSDPSATYEQVNRIGNIDLTSSSMTYNCCLVVPFQAVYEREQQYKPKILVPAPPPPTVNDTTANRTFSPMEMSLPSQPSDNEQEFQAASKNAEPASTPSSSAASTPTPVGLTRHDTNNSSLASSVVAMEEDSQMSVSTPISPATTESESKQSTIPILSVTFIVECR